MEVSLQLVLYFEQRLLFHPGPDSNLVLLCSICIVRGALQWQESYNIGILSQREHNNAQSSIMHCSVGGGLHVCEYVNV